jgi:phage tail sheath gpL-like
MSGSIAVTDGSIQFVEIPYTWKVPGNYMEVKPAINDNAVLPFPAQGLVVGMMDAASSTVSAAPGQPYQINSGAQADGPRRGSGAGWMRTRTRRSMLSASRR